MEDKKYAYTYNQKEIYNEKTMSGKVDTEHYGSQERQGIQQVTYKQSLCKLM